MNLKKPASRMIGASVVFALAAVALLSSTADAQPLLPMQLSGTLTVEGNPAPQSVPISARLRQGSFTITFKSTFTRSDGTYVFNVPADDTSTTVKDGFVQGDTVLVFVEEQEITSVTFTKGRVVTVNLSVDSLETGSPVTATPSVAAIVLDLKRPVCGFSYSTYTPAVLPTAASMLMISELFGLTEATALVIDGAASGAAVGTRVPVGFWVVIAVTASNSSLR